LRALPLLLVAGCFSPSVPSGGYQCSPADNVCPSGLHCACGLCVKSDEDAACNLAVTFPGDQSMLSVREHESFLVNVAASTKSGAPSTGFHGTVDLSFRLPDGTVWGDVRPSTVQLQKGQAQLMVTVNRETIPPQEPSIVASFASTEGASQAVHVTPQPLARDVAAVAQAPFGWADLAVGFPSVAWDGQQFRMYSIGAGKNMVRGVALAVSPNGASFSPQGSAPLFPGSASFTPGVLSAFPYQLKDGWHLAMYANDEKGAGDIWTAHSADGTSTFTLDGSGSPAVGRTDCAYCDYTVWFPSVLVDGAQELMFFGAMHCEKTMGMMCMNVTDSVSAAIGRAHSTDGVSFQPEPAPVLSGDMGGETYLAAPQVVKDGSIYKMWYAFTRQLTFGDPCLAQIDVGYATSTDGFYWVRSPSNPVVSLDGTGWEGTGPSAMVPGSVVPKDGKDFESGVMLYYSPLQTILVPPFCVPSGIGRAVSP
jgi:hypothetical protein